MVIMMDIDGVLADFVSAFTHTAAAIYPHAVHTSALQQTTWIEAGGVSLYDRKVWDLLLNLDWWWYSLPQLVFKDTTERIALLNRRVPIYFVTNRRHDKQSPVLQTRAWLRDRLGITDPAVICTKYKGEAARLLKATHSIEDKLENAWCVHWLTGDPPCKSYLLDRPYNRIAEPFGPQVERLATVSDFLTICEKEAGIATI